MFLFRSTKKGFTLLELLTVIAIIGLLATIVMVSLNVARMKGRDAQRMSVVKELQKAIELYYSEYNFYPPISGLTDAVSRSSGVTCVDGTTGDAEWCEFIASIAPYHKGGIDDPLSVGILSYYYDADGPQPTSYGLMVIFESTTNAALTNEDGGYYCQAGAPTCTAALLGYEIGDAPRRCQAIGQLWRSPGC